MDGAIPFVSHASPALHRDAITPSAHPITSSVDAISTVGPTPSTKDALPLPSYLSPLSPPPPALVDPSTHAPPTSATPPSFSSVATPRASATTQPGARALVWLQATLRLRDNPILEHAAAL